MYQFINRKKEYYLKLNVLIDMELNDLEKSEAQSDMLEFCKKYIQFKNLSGVGEIVKANNYEGILIKDCGFPTELNRAFFANDIYYLSDLSRFSYTEMYDFVYEIIRNSPKSRQYTDMIYQLMKEHSIVYKGINPDELIKIADCGLSVRATNALVKANFVFLQDVTVNTRERIRQIRSFGEGCLKELDSVLNEHDLWYAEKDSIFF